MLRSAVRHAHLPIALALALTACGKVEEPDPKPQPDPKAKPSASAPAVDNAAAKPKLPPPPAGKLEIVDMKVGDGAEAKAGNTVKVHYTGTLTNGSKFDSSLDRKEPFEFKLGAGSVIRGWDEGVAGMKVGGKRKLTIPPDMGYGVMGSPPKIPGNSTLLFEIELLDVK